MNKFILNDFANSWTLSTVSFATFCKKTSSSGFIKPKWSYSLFSGDFPYNVANTVAAAKYVPKIIAVIPFIFHWSKKYKPNFTQKDWINYDEQAI